MLTLAFGGSVGKEGPCAQIGAAITSLFADVLRLDDKDRRRLVICGVGAGFAAVFGTPVSGALFGIEVLYLGRIEYPVLFPCLVAGIVAHLVCGTSAPVPALHEDLSLLGHRTIVPLAILFGAALRPDRPPAHREHARSRAAAAPLRAPPVPGRCRGRGGARALLPRDRGAVRGSRHPVIEASLAGTAQVVALAFLFKIVATAVTLETGGSGGIVTPLFFIGATSGVALAHASGLDPGVVAAFGFVSVLAAAANTPIAAAVMGMELLPHDLGVYAALCAGTAFLLVGHRSVYASQKLGLSKSGGLEVPFDVAIGDVEPRGPARPQGQPDGVGARRARAGVAAGAGARAGRAEPAGLRI